MAQKTHCFRLTRGQDLFDDIAEYAKQHNIRAAVVLSAVGCVYAYRIRDASGVNMREGEMRAEILSLMGTVSQSGLHIHIGLAGEDTLAFGGHLTQGCKVNTTAEIVLLEIEDTLFTRELDASTGYDELVIKQL